MALAASGSIDSSPSLDTSDNSSRGINRRLNKQLLAVLVVAFLVIFASRISRLPHLDMETDEVWSVWQTLGTVRQTVQWVSYDATPTYFLLVHGWRFLTGINPFGLRLFTVLLMMLSSAMVYRLGCKLFGPKSGLMAMFAFSALGYMVFLSTLLRPYMLSILLWLLALWQTIEYFENVTAKNKISRWRAVFLALNLAALFYIHITAVFAILFLGLYALLIYRRWKPWILPAIITLLLCLPEAISKLSVVTIKSQLVQEGIPDVPILTRLINHYLDYFGQQPALWGALLLITTALILDHWRLNRKVLTLILWMLMPIALVWVTVQIDAFNARHLAWVMVGIVFWLGWGLSYLPRPAFVALIVVFGLASFDYLPLNERYETLLRPPLITSFDTLRTVYRGGDALLIDSGQCVGCIGVSPFEWDYVSRAYYPAGMTFISPDQISTHRRIWYISAKGHENPTTFGGVQKGRSLSYSFGQDGFLWRLYEASPNTDGILFANGMRFHGAELLNGGNLPTAWHKGETITVRLWWSTDRALTNDYSEALFVVDPASAQVKNQTDTAPQIINGPQQTSKWELNQVYIEERTISLPTDLPPSEYNYQLKLAIYYFGDQKRITAPGVDDNIMLPIGNAFVRAL